jgi:hypothetical protein
MFENRVLSRIFEPKTDEVIGEWKRLHNEELYDLYSSPNIIPLTKSRRMRMAVPVALMGDRRVACRFFVWRLLGNRPLEIPRCIWEDNIKMALQEVEWEHGLD